MSRHHPAAGATGDYPLGKLRPGDEGGLNMVMTVDKEQGLIYLDFGQRPVTLAGIMPDDARRFAALLLTKAAELDG